MNYLKDEAYQAAGLSLFVWIVVHQDTCNTGTAFEFHFLDAELSCTVSCPFLNQILLSELIPFQICESTVQQNPYQ